MVEKAWYRLSLRFPFRDEEQLIGMNNVVIAVHGDYSSLTHLSLPLHRVLWCGFTLSTPNSYNAPKL
jgi:hypothetical protein